MSESLVILSARLGAPTAEDRRLEEYGARLRGAPLFTRDEILQNGADAAFIILGAVEPFDRSTLEALPRLAAIIRRGVGYDNVDIDAATNLGIVVANVPDASTDEVADHALALLLNLERQVADLDRAVRGDTWRAAPASLQARRIKSRRLNELTLGVVGLGRIGQGLVRRAAPLYRQILASDPFVTQAPADLGTIELVSLPDLLQRSDHVSLHVPMSPSSRRLLGAEQLAQMPDGAILVNTARPGLVDESAVRAALMAGRLAGAGLDVTEREPLPAEDELLRITERLLLTGHSAAWSSTANAALATASVDATVDLLADRRPTSLVNPEVLSSRELRLHALHVPPP